MIDNNTLSLFRDRYKAMSVDGRGDDTSSSTRVLTLGLVVNTDDPLEQGRLQIFCPALNDNPKKIQHLPWAAYITPYGGSINSASFTRGTGDGTATSEGAIHYGFWGVPELGAHVLVGCIDGDARRRFWVGCVPEHQETHTQFTGRFDWSSENGTPDGPLTSSKKPIQPLYDNMSKAFVDRQSREWKTRGADYQPMSIPKNSGGFPSRVRGPEYLDDTYEGIASNENDEWVKDIVGSHGYDWSAFKNVGAYKSSRVYGMSTPGLHSFSMDDRPFNSRMKFLTATGHMLLMDDTNERIYIMTNKGNNWIEMDSNGNIDVYSERRVSVNAAKDINFTTGGTFRVHADSGIHLYAGHAAEEYRGSLAIPPKRGEIRIQSEDDIHVLGLNVRQRSVENTYTEVGINRYETVGDSAFQDVMKDINVRTLSGDYIKTVANNLHETIMQNSKRLSYGTSALSSNGDNEVFSFHGGMAVGSQGDTSIKSNAGDINVEAVGSEGGGKINQKTPDAQHSLGPSGVDIMTSASITQKAAQEISSEIKPGATMAGLMGGVSSSSVIKLAMGGVDIQSAADINFKAMGSGLSTGYTDMVTTINSTVVGLNMLTYYTSALTNAVSAVASAAGTSMPSMPFSFDLGSLTAGLLTGALPTALTNVYATLQDLENQIVSLGLVGFTIPVTLETIVDELVGNTSALQALGLPVSLSFPVNPSILGAISILQQLNLNIDVNEILALIIPDFRATVDSIFSVITSSTPMPIPPMPVARPALDAIVKIME